MQKLKLKKRISQQAQIKTGAILIVLFFIALNIFGATGQIKNFAYTISSPFQKIFWQAGESASNFFETIAKIKKLDQENKALQLENAELTAKLAKAEELKQQNEDLRLALNIGFKKEFKVIIAEIASKDAQKDSILINKGEQDGLTKNMPVITPQKILLGKISHIYKNFSRVMLVSHKDISCDAKILTSKDLEFPKNLIDLKKPLLSEQKTDNPQTEEKSAELSAPEEEKDLSAFATQEDILGIIRGKGNFSLSLDFIPQEKNVQKGDLIVTTSLSKLFPKGLLIGQITTIKKSDLQPFQEIEAKPLFDIKKLKTLFIADYDYSDIGEEGEEGESKNND